MKRRKAGSSSSLAGPATSWRLRRLWRKAVKLLLDPVRFFDDAKQPGLRRAGLRCLLVLHSLPLTPHLLGYVTIRLLWRISGGRGLRLRALRGLQRQGHGWLALDTDPQFELRGWLPLPRGPSHIALTLHGFTGEEPSKLYVGGRRRHGDQGFEEAAALAIPLELNGRGECLVVLPQRHRLRLRFDPLGAPGAFEITSLRLRPASHGATLARLRRAAWPPETALAYLLTGNPPRRRHPRRAGIPAGDLAKAREPSAKAWAGLSPPSPARVSEARIDVVVPVYGDRAATLACLYSVLANPQATAFALTVIDDCGPDPSLRATLVELADRGLFRLIRNQRNLGFVRSANLAMALAPRNDLILLNADTEVYNDWLDRLVRLAADHPDAATITPLTNNGEIASYPYFTEAFPWRLELDFAALDRLAAKANGSASLDAPTGVGFCLYLRRRAIERLGRFDERDFGLGYGEENDFCQRALAAGWRNLIAPGVFVRHLGQRSFGDSRARRVVHALAVLERRYPHYRASIERFIESDPMAPYRAALDRARITRLPRRAARLAILHSIGGGTEAHVLDRATRLAGEGVLLLIGRPSDPPNGRRVSLEVAGTPHLPNLPAFDLLGDLEPLVAFLAGQQLEAIELHNLVGYAEAVVTVLPELARRLKVPLDVHLHDYQAFCPRINLVTPELEFCDVADAGRCRLCLARGPGQIAVADVKPWRRRYARLLRGARRVVAPSEDAAARFARHLPGLPVEICPHPDLAVWDLERDSTLRLPPPRNTVRRICLIGSISDVKGQRLLAQVARLALVRGSALEFVVLGEVGNPLLLRGLGNVTVTGRYAEEEALPALRHVNAQIAWFPALWPETFCYTLSLAQRVGLPCLVPALGALTRGNDAPSGRTLSYAPATAPPELLALLETAFPASGIGRHARHMRYT